MNKEEEIKKLIPLGAKVLAKILVETAQKIKDDKKYAQLAFEKYGEINWGYIQGLNTAHFNLTDTIIDTAIKEGKISLFKA